jgi:Ca2+-binding RTX toxin-like protein
VATVNITVTAVNDAPMAVNDSYITAQDTSLTVAASGVLANDSDVDGGPLTSILVTGPTHGSLTQNANGSFTYMPTAGYNGPDSYTYKANDGAADSNVATVSITVTPASVPSVQMLNDPNRPGTMLVVTMTNANDVVTLTPTANAGEYRVTLNGLIVGAYSPTGSVQIYGNGGIDSFVLNGTSSSNAFEVRSDRLVLNALPFFDHAVATRQINALGSSDTITVYGGGATVDGGAGSDTLVATGAISHDWQITAQNTGSLDGLVFFSSVEQLVGGAGADTFHLGNNGRITGSIDGGAGSDVLIGPNSANTWKIDVANGGTVKNTSFIGLESLQGGSDADKFRMLPGGSFAGTIDGGSGTDLLDYSAYTTAVTVNLGAGTATGTGGVSGFEDIAGGDGNDLLAGNAAANDISGGNGDDIILGLAGNDTLDGNAGMDIVAGGSGADTVHGNNGDDILVGGVLTYADESSFAINQAALNAIMAEWTRNLAYSMRIGHLTVNSSGGFNGGFMLNSSTVQDDFAVDMLFGDAGQDWFLAEINDIVKTTKGEMVTDL